MTDMNTAIKNGWHKLAQRSVNDTHSYIEAARRAGKEKVCNIHELTFTEAAQKYFETLGYTFQRYETVDGWRLSIHWIN